MRIFLGGPIQALAGDGALLSSARQMIITASNYFSSAGAEVLSAHIIEEFGDLTHKWTPIEVTRRDRDWMQKCDVFIALLPKSSDGKLARSDGTHVELGWASALGKPIILVVDSDVEGETSHLVKGLGAVAHVTRVDSQALRSDPGRVMKLANDVLRLAKEIQNA